MTQFLYSIIVLLGIVVLALIVKFYYLWKENREEDHAIGLDWTEADCVDEEELKFRGKVLDELEEEIAYKDE